jgi:hypothetical protein
MGVPCSVPCPQYIIGGKCRLLYWLLTIIVYRPSESDPRRISLVKQLRFAFLFSSCMKKLLIRTKLTSMDMNLAHTCMIKIIMQLIF